MIRNIEIEDWSEILELEVQWPTDIYRGQANAEWPLSSSIKRLLSEDSDFGRNIGNPEFWLLRKFKKGTKKYLDDVPKDDDLISWFSLMQHHGTPTRLIDFSYSFYVACYFALIDAEGDSAIWSISTHWLLKMGHEIFSLPQRDKLRDEDMDNLYEESNNLLNEVFCSATSASNNKAPVGAAIVEPFDHHKRLGAQQGVFLLPFQTRKTILENLEPFEDLYSYEPIKKIVLKENVKQDGLAHLKQMNITSESLFPGIDGFARSIVHKTLNK